MREEKALLIQERSRSEIYEIFLAKNAKKLAGFEVFEGPKPLPGKTGLVIMSPMSGFLTVASLLWLALAAQDLADVRQALERGDLQQAESSLKGWIEQHPQEPEGHRLMGQLRLQQGRLGDAEVAFRRALQADPADIQVLYQLGILAAEGRRFTDALGYLKQIPESKAPSGYWETVGRLLASQGDFQRAEEAYRRHLQQHPNSIRTLRSLSGLALKQANLEQAWRYIARARSQAPHSPRVLHDFAQVSLAHGLSAEAAAAARLLMLMEPSNPDYGFLLGRTLLNDHTSEALQLFQSFAAQRPESLEGQMMLGVSHYLLGQFVVARKCFESALGLEPGLSEGLYYLGMVAYKEARDEEAERCLLETLQKVPDHGRARLGLGKVYLRLGKDEEAMQELKQAASLLERDSEVHFQLSRLYRQQGSLELARRELEIYRQLKQEEQQGNQRAAELPFTLRGEKR